jgi:hypothetical protein
MEARKLEDLEEKYERKYCFAEFMIGSWQSRRTGKQPGTLSATL